MLSLSSFAWASLAIGSISCLGAIVALESFFCVLLLSHCFPAFPTPFAFHRVLSMAFGLFPDRLALRFHPRLLDPKSSSHLSRPLPSKRFGALFGLSRCCRRRRLNKAENWVIRLSLSRNFAICFAGLSMGLLCLGLKARRTTTCAFGDFSLSPAF